MRTKEWTTADCHAGPRERALTFESPVGVQKDQNVPKKTQKKEGTGLEKPGIQRKKECQPSPSIKLVEQNVWGEPPDRAEKGV